MEIRFGPGDVPEALRGTRPRWWRGGERPVLAWGPFVVEDQYDGFRIGACLRVER